MKSLIVVLLLASPLISHAGQTKVERKSVAKASVQKRTQVTRPAPQARKIANTNPDQIKVIQQTTIEIDEGD